MTQLSFPGSSAGKEFVCNSGDPSSISGSGRFPGEENGYALQYSWASLVAQLVKNSPAMWETCVWFLSWEDPLEKRTATHSSILVWRIPWGCKEWDTTEQLSLNTARLAFQTDNSGNTADYETRRTSGGHQDQRRINVTTNPLILALEQD